MGKLSLVAILVCTLAVTAAFHGLFARSAESRTPTATPTPPWIAGAANTPTNTPTSQRPWNLSAVLIDDYPSFPMQGVTKTWVFRIANYGSEYGCETSPWGAVHVGLSGHADTKFNFDVGSVECNQYFDIDVSSVVTAAPGAKISATSSAAHIPYPNVYNASDHVCFVTDPAVCAVDADDDGCPTAVEERTEAGSQKSGGLRDPANPYDYFNPTHDGINRIDDVLAVVDQYFKDDIDSSPGEPPYVDGYSPETDRYLIGPNAWNVVQPDGLQRTDDIVNVINQYFHDCA